MEELIKVRKTQMGDLISAKELYQFLGLRIDQWKRWSDLNILKNKFAISGTDYIPIEPIRHDVEKLKNSNLGVKPSMDYGLTLDFAKRIAMMSRTEKGEQARNYFIACENRLKQLSAIEELSPAELMAKALEVAKKTIEDREKRLSEYREIILEQMIAVEYTNKVLNSQDTLYTATQIAKELKMTTVRFNKTLQEYRIQYSQNGQWVLYDTYINRDYARNRTFPYTDENGVPRTSTQLMWTEKGRYFIHTILNKEFDGVAVLNSPIFYQ